MKHICKLTMLMIWLCQISISKAEELIIVKGAQKAVIVPGPSPVEKYAARELQRAIQRMTGAQLVITNDAVPTAQIVIEVQPLSGDEQITIKRSGNILHLTGSTPRAALYATYTFLTDVLGARWYWPGESGEYLPRKESIVINELNISENPSLSIRSLAITGVPNGDPDTDTWMAGNRLNLVSSRAGADSTGELTPKRREKGFIIRVAGHNVVLPDSLLKAHPEYLAQIGGKRQPHPKGASHLCWSNPAVQTEVANMIASWWKQPPYPDIIHFYPADQTLYCQCDACKAMGDVSTRWQKFSSIVISKLDQLVPGKKYWTYAYLQYKTVPQVKPAPFDFIPYTMYDVSYRHLMSGGNAYNKESVAEIDGWLHTGVNVGIRGYEYIIFKKPMVVPMVSWVVDQVNWMHGKHINGYLSELPAYGMPQNEPAENTYWTSSRMSLYAVTKVLWNHKLTAREIVNDWCKHIYGPAATEMEAYYWDMERAWRSSPKNISIFTNAPASHVDDFLTPALFKTLYRHLEKARRAAGKQQRILAQIELEKKMLDKWQKVYDMKHLKNQVIGGPKSILLFGAGDESIPLAVELQEQGWGVAVGKKKLNTPVVLVRYRGGELPDLKEYIQKGGVVIISAESEIPVQNWFPAVKWTGPQKAIFRKAAFIQPGEWQKTPNDLQQVLSRGTTPVTGFIPMCEGWEVLAEIPLANDEKAAFLLRKKIGKGTLVLTSAPMGYSGGFEMLGHRNTLNVVKLIENLNK